MKLKVQWKKYLPSILVGGLIPAAIILSSYFAWPKTLAIPLVIVLILIFASTVLWSYANRETDGSEWWQDDSASGWRGY